jgi:hypothetical protein
MLPFIRAGLAALVCAAMGACATTAVESQSKLLSAQSARIYILRPGALAGGAMPANVKINGAKVGSIANNSYLFIDRPPGRHKIEVRVTAALAGVEHEAQVVAGRTYYFSFNAVSATVMMGPVPVLFAGPTAGQKVGQSSFLSNGHLAEVDAATATAMMSRMKAP